METEGTCEEWPMHACVLMERGCAAWDANHAGEGYFGTRFFLHGAACGSLVCGSKTIRILIWDGGSILHIFLCSVLTNIY